jgi:hypothetical protein
MIPVDTIYKNCINTPMILETLAPSFFRSLPYVQEPDVVVATPHGMVSVMVKPREEFSYTPGDVAFFVHSGTPYRIRLTRPYTRVGLVRALRKFIAEFVGGGVEAVPVKRGPS